MDKKIKGADIKTMFTLFSTKPQISLLIPSDIAMIIFVANFDRNDQ
jgi:hypothetical protein